MSFARSISYRARSPSTSISSEISRFDWPYLIAPAFWCATFHSRSAVNDTTGADPSEASHLLKSRFMPYFSTTEQSASLPLALSAPEHMPHVMKLFFVSLSTMLGMSAGSTITAPSFLSTAIASSITFF